VLPPNGDVPGLAITDAVWRSMYGADPQIVGKTAWLGAHPVVITGVLEPRFRGFPPLVHEGVLILNQATAQWLTRKPAMLTDPKQCCIEVFGRRRPGFTFAQISNEIALRANAVHAGVGVPIITVNVWNTAMASRPGGVRNTVPALFALLFTGCGIVTLLACANIGNLQLARGLRRSREVAVRLALGASRRRLVRQFLTESAVLACIGGAGGLVIAWTVPSAIMSLDISSSTTYKPDAIVILFAAGTAALATLLSGLAPAIRVTRIDWQRGASTAAPGAHRLRGVLLATQIALSLGLIASASLLSRGALRAATGADAGFEFENINAIVLAVTSADDTVAAKAARAAVHQAVAAIPDVALVDTAPWTGISETAKLNVPGRAEPLTAELSGFNRGAVTLLQIPLVAGRWHSDDKGMYEVTVSRSLARALWNDDNVLGRTFVKTGEPHPYTVVGMIDEVRLVDATARPTAIVAPRGTYLPTVLGRPGVETQLKTIVAAIDPSIRVMPRPLIDGLRKQMKGSFMGISIASGLALVALLLASLGVFGVVAYVVEERRREIGVRLALGANRAQVRRSIVAAMRWPVIGGLAAGLVFAIIGGFVLRSNLYGLSVLDPVSYLAVAALLSAAAIAATYIPMRRATRVDPAVTLRAD
jgi:predicted permease